MSEMLADEQVATSAEPAASSDNVGADDWKASLPEDLRSHPSIENMPDVASLAKSMVHAQSMVGADR